jgi:hypothetical protein
MASQEHHDSCAVCGEKLPDDPPEVTIPTGFAVRMTPLANPGVQRIRFCSERHRRDWVDAQRGEWPDDEGSDAGN